MPSLTETAARPGDSSARVCGDNQKRYTPGFTALTERGVVPSWSPVRCDGGRNRVLLQLITVIICAGPPGGVACPRGGSARKKAHFCDFIVIIIMCVTCCF
ncbi:hypothetical protein D3S87_12880 [Escherichia coli]|nr:hypothetical protein [Escherichia coli]EFN9933339.1 hypothetical protein [Escherichia coli]EGE3374258.1 hypothetical protein [Escherichia coli]PDV47980.1 hypothetical protein BER13_24315 [Escherichia coli]